MERLTIKAPSGLIHLKDNKEMTVNEAIKNLAEYEDLLDDIENQMTAYDVDKVVERINSIGKSYCESVNCDKNCQDCEHGCIMRAVEAAIKAGGVYE